MKEQKQTESQLKKPFVLYTSGDIKKQSVKKIDKNDINNTNRIFGFTSFFDGRAYLTQKLHFVGLDARQYVMNKFPNKY